MHIFGNDNAAGAANPSPVESPAPGVRSVRNPSNGDIQRELLLEMVQEIRRMSATVSGIAARSRSQLLNSVLQVGVFTIGADGSLVRSFQTQVGSVIISNATGATVTVQAGTSGSNVAPTSGSGVSIVPNNTVLAIPIGAHSFTLYGTAGTNVSVQAFTDMTAFGVH